MCGVIRRLAETIRLAHEDGATEVLKLFDAFSGKVIAVRAMIL